MEKFFEKNEKYLLAGITGIAAVLRFFRLTRADMVTDAATYSFRAIGYADTMVSQVQTTPLQWFGYFPWWSKLSFHDHPPVSFLIQNIFFKIFGVSLLSARLPHALFGLLSIIVLYYLAKKLYGIKVALLSSLLLAVSNYHVWTSQSGYIEPIMIFFILLSFLFWLKAKNNSKFFILWALFFGLAILTKYTALFLLPVFAVILILDKNNFNIVKKSKFFYFSVFLFLLLILPLAVYNLMMFKTRGHFDLQLATLFGQDLSDWSVLSGQKVGINLLGNTKGMFFILLSSSPFMLIIFLAGFVFMLYDYFVKKAGKHLLMILTLIFLILFFILTSPAERLLPIFEPFISVVSAYFLIFLAVKFKVKNFFLFPLLSLTLIYLVVFTVNTNHLYRPNCNSRWIFSKIRIENWGYNQLNEWLENDVGKSNLSNFRKITELKDIYMLDSNEYNLGKLYIYDRNVNWFAYLWYFKAKAVYNGLAIISTDDLGEVLMSEKGLETISHLGRSDTYFIKATDNVLKDSDKNTSTTAEEIENQFKESGFLPVKIIKNPRGEDAFKIYSIKSISVDKDSTL
ncbi:phospholipid carrier-dependent glycosyltransferase [Candidatus Parcubacteria bacterium]|nr:MAG: phospholipid carrier-dependent glycosyltransferase [Candidatus Parcubacteria bacterium]